MTTASTGYAKGLASRPMCIESSSHDAPSRVDVERNEVALNWSNRRRAGNIPTPALGNLLTGALSEPGRAGSRVFCTIRVDGIRTAAPLDDPVLYAGGSAHARQRQLRHHLDLSLSRLHRR